MKFCQMCCLRRELESYCILLRLTAACNVWGVNRSSAIDRQAGGGGRVPMVGLIYETDAQAHMQMLRLARSQNLITTNDFCRISRETVSIRHDPSTYNSLVTNIHQNSPKFTNIHQNSPKFTNKHTGSYMQITHIDDRQGDRTTKIVSCQFKHVKGPRLASIGAASRGPWGQNKNPKIWDLGRF